MRFGLVAVEPGGHPGLVHRQPRFLSGHDVFDFLAVVTSHRRSCRGHTYVVAAANKSFVGAFPAKGFVTCAQGSILIIFTDILIGSIK